MTYKTKSKNVVDKRHGKTGTLMLQRNCKKHMYKTLFFLVF